VLGAGAPATTAGWDDALLAELNERAGAQ